MVLLAYVMTPLPTPFTSTSSMTSVMLKLAALHMKYPVHVPANDVTESKTIHTADVKLT